MSYPSDYDSALQYRAWVEEAPAVLDSLTLEDRLHGGPNRVLAAEFLRAVGRTAEAALLTAPGHVVVDSEHRVRTGNWNPHSLTAAETALHRYSADYSLLHALPAPEPVTTTLSALPVARLRYAARYTRWLQSQSQYLPDAVATEMDVLIQQIATAPVETVDPHAEEPR